MDETLYTQAHCADAAFQTECERQFGRDAREARYMGELHDEATKAARSKYHAAMEALRASWKR